MDWVQRIEQAQRMRYFATYLIYFAVIVRAIGWSQDTAPIPAIIWILLALFGGILFTQQMLTRRFPRYPRYYTLVQSGLAIAMFYSAPTIDFLSMLLIPLCFQAVQFFPNRIGFAWIGILVLAMAGMLFVGMEWEAGLTMVLGGAGAGFLMGSFAYLINRTEQRQEENQRLFANLQEAYGQLKDSAAQAEALAAATERHHLVRELHDSLTQTLFSMNLAVQSAQLSLGEIPLQIDEHLMRLQTLVRSATSEVQSLTGRAPHRPPALGGLGVALQKLSKERMEQDALVVNIEISGERALPAQVEANLYRIAQEALNNITRHAGVCQAIIRLRLEGDVACLEIEDHGRGFDLSGSRHSGFGLAGMTERAGEIGWDLKIKSNPGQGTLIRVEEQST
jgi:signal transduction histidine kinase